MLFSYTLSIVDRAYHLDQQLYRYASSYETFVPFQSKDYDNKPNCVPPFGFLVLYYDVILVHH